MSREKIEPELIYDVEIKEGVKLVAFCLDCHSVLFKGNDSSAIERRVLRERIHNHLETSNWDHDVEVIYPNREKEKSIDAQIFLSTGAFITIGTVHEHHHQSTSRRTLGN